MMFFLDTVQRDKKTLAPSSINVLEIKEHGGINRGFW